jgi:hypothetical protein
VHAEALKANRFLRAVAESRGAPAPAPAAEGQLILP